MNRKAKGGRNERKARDILEKEGYSVCKSGGSLGVWDLIAINRERIRLIQVKTNNQPSKLELDKMKLFEAPSNTTKELWVFIDWKKQPLIRCV